MYGHLSLNCILLEAFVEKTFAIHRKSMKTTKLFSRVAFVIYGMFNVLLCKINSLIVLLEYIDLSILIYINKYLGGGTCYLVLIYI